MNNPSITHLKPWGAWATTAFGVLIMMVFIVVQTGVGILFSVATGMMEPPVNSEQVPVQLVNNGFYLSLATISTTLICCSLIVLMIRGRKQLSAANYLGLHRFKWQVFSKWLLLLFSIIVIDALATSILDIPVPDFMLETYRTAGILPLFWLAIVIAAPVFEETFFRGFLLEGLRRTWMGNLGAIILISAAWAFMHIQYDLYYIGLIFILGVVLGYSKLKSGSLYISMALHAISNFIAMMQVALLY